MMKQISVIFICRLVLTALSVILFCTVSALAARSGTIRLKDGTVYENITFKTDNIYKVIEFKVEDQKTTVSFTDIESILDDEGQDITAEVLGGYVKAEDRDSFLPEDHEVYKHGHRKLWTAGFSVAGNYSIPAGNYYDGMDPGIGFDADFIVALTYKLALRATVSYNGMDFEEDLAFILPIAPDEYLMVDNYSFSSMSYFLSFQYYHRPDRDTPGKIIYYFYSGLGAVTHKVEADDVYVSGGVEVYRIPMSLSETKFATTFGGGLIHLFEPQIGFYAGANVDVVYIGTASDDYDYWGSNMEYAYQFDLKLGLVLLIK